jgi:branched-chain amino acid transport system ATP-binding protein
MPLLEVRHVSKRFGGVHAVRGVSFAVEQGEILGLMGANGAGKTTLFSLIAGEVRPDSGEMLLEGRTLVGLRPDRICRLGVGRAFQIVKPFAGLSVRDGLLAAAYFGAAGHRSRHAARTFCDEILGEFELLNMAAREAHTLTLSAQKRLELARAVATGAKLLLIDEVMAGLTPTEVAAMLVTLREVHRRRGTTILIIEHVMQALMQLADRVVVLHHGERIAEGKPESIARDPRVLEVYFGEEVAA